VQIPLELSENVTSHLIRLENLLETEEKAVDLEAIVSYMSSIFKQETRSGLVFGNYKSYSLKEVTHAGSKVSSDFNNHPDESKVTIKPLSLRTFKMTTGRESKA